MKKGNEMLTKRDTKALEVLKDGGYFVKKLETIYYPVRRDMFVTRLYDNMNNVVKGFGVKTLFNLQDENMIERDFNVASSSAYPEKFVLKG